MSQTSTDHHDDPAAAVHQVAEVAALQQELHEVEQGLSLSASSSSSGNRGRAVFDSIGSALGSMRNRLQRLHHSSSNSSSGPALATATATAAVSSAIDTSSLISNDPTSSLTALSERLQTAEHAHSTRMPLHFLQRQRREQQQTSPSASSESLPRRAPPGTNVNATSSEAGGLKRAVSAKEEQGSQSDSELSSSSLRSGTRRMSSTLVASRRHSQAQEHNDIAIHETGGDATIMLHLPTSIEEDADADTDDTERSEVDVLIPSKSIQKLNNEQSNVLMGSSLLLLKKSTSGGPSLDLLSPIYSWGTWSNSSNDDYNVFGGGEKVEANSSPSSLSSFIPQLIPPDCRLGRTKLVSLAVNEHHMACATAMGGVLVCGDNSQGAVDPSQRDVPSIMRPMHLEQLTMTRITQVSCGLDHTAALSDTRSILTWGHDQYGQLGHRSKHHHNKPNSNDSDKNDYRFRPPAAIVLLGKRAARVACGHGFTLVLTTRMEVLVCGREELSGYNVEEEEQINDNNADNNDDNKNKNQHWPAQQPALQGLPLVYIAAGRQHAVVVTAHGTAYAWGSNASGACGREFPKSLRVPVPIQVPASVLPKPSGHDATDRTTDNNAFANWTKWDGPNAPMTLANDLTVIHAACGGDHTVLVTQTGQLLVAGNNQFGQLGLDVNSNDTQMVAPVEILAHPLGKKFVSAEAGTDHTLLLDDQGDVWSMGGSNANSSGDPKFLKQVLVGKSIRKVAAGGSQNVVIGESKQEAKEAVDTKLTMTNAAPGLERLLDGILLKQEGAESAAKELASQTEELFKCPAVMNSLFLDPNEINDMYHELIAATGDAKVRQHVVSAMEKGMMQGLESIRTARLMYPQSVRCLLMYLQCPLFREEKELDIAFDVRGELILSLCESILGLPFEGYKAFLTWSTFVYSKELFAPFLVKPLVVQLNKRLEKDRTRAVPVIVGVLRWFQNVAERSEEPIAAHEDFHSKGIGDLPVEALLDDLRRFKTASKSERSGNFFIVANPFLLSPGAKRNLLQVENQVTMIHAAQSQGVQFDAARREFLFQPYFILSIDREYMLQQTLKAVSAAPPGNLRKSLKIVFKGEDGVDAGGVTKEFFQLLIAKLFDINTGMWTMDFGDGLNTWFNSDCIWNYDSFYLVGVLVGLAVYNGVILDAHFPHTVYRKLLGLPLGLEDMVDEDVRNGMQSLLDYEGDDVEDIFCMTFEVTWMDLGMERRRELKPGGAEIPVTTDNKEEYVMLYVKWLLVDSIESQYDEFNRGFTQVMEDSSLDLLRPEELELLVVGTPELDFVALEKNAEYEGYDKDAPVVKNLWLFVKDSPRETQLKFLKFATGSTRAPIGGLGELPFKIQRAGPDSIQLPTSHTCFNTLLVPDYGDNYEKLAERVGRAVIECEGFGLQ